MEPGHRVAFGSLLRPGHRVKPDTISHRNILILDWVTESVWVTFAIGSPGHYLLTRFHLWFASWGREERKKVKGPPYVLGFQFSKIFRNGKGPSLCFKVPVFQNFLEMIRDLYVLSFQFSKIL